MLGIIKKLFIVLLSNIVNGFNHTFINLHPIEYSQEFHYYTSAVNLLLMTYLIKYVFQIK